MLAQLHHSANLIHGDLTTSNIMIKQQKKSVTDYSLVLIDFGLSFTSHLAEDRAVDLYVLERAVRTTHGKGRLDKGLMQAVYEAYAAEGRAVMERIAANDKHTRTGKQLKQREQNDAATVLRRLREVRQRGRKRDMLG